MHAVGVLADVSLGNYVSPWKVLLLVILLLVWTRLLTWVDKDTIDAHLPRIGFNIGNLSGLIFGFLIFLVMPSFMLGLPVLIVVMAAEAGVYLMIRNQKVGLKDLSTDFQAWLKSFGGKEKQVVVAAGSVGLITKSGAIVAVPDAESPDLPGYDALQRILTDPLKKGATRIDVAPGESNANVRYTVDGVRYDGAALNKADGTSAVQYIKQLAGLDVSDKRKPQNGALKVSVAGKKHDMQITTAGSTAGESMTIEMDPKKRHDLALADLGLSADQEKVLRDWIASDENGIGICAAPSGQGLTSMLYGVIRGHDAFLQHIQTIERNPDQDLEGITQNKLPATATGADELKSMDWVSSQEPDIVMMPKVSDSSVAAVVIKYASNEGKKSYIGMRSAGALEALDQWRKLVGDDSLALKSLKFVLAGRVGRKLCQACKVEYAPDPDTLKRLNMSPDRAGRLYQARSQPLRDAKGNPITCDFCHDMHFKGQFGVFEIFLIDDEVRQVLTSGGSVNQLKMLFKKQKRKTLQESALSKAVDGETSLQEVARILRLGTESSSGGSSKRSSSKKPV